MANSRNNKAVKDSRPKSQGRGRRNDKRFERASVNDGRNDFSWYNKNPLLTESVARIPFPYRPGMELPDVKLLNSAASQAAFPRTVPGIMTLEWIPAVGYSKDNLSPISMTAKDIFSKVRSAFSGSIMADAPDFIMHIMAMDSIYAYISWLKRVYRASGTFTLNNHLTPEVLLQAMGFEPNGALRIMKERTRLWGLINELVAMTDSFIVPDEFPIITRHMWMSERAYSDAFSLNAQMYLFNCTNWYKFATDEAGAGSLALTKLDLTQIETSGVEYLYTFGRTLIEALSAWDDAYIINGYLAKVYGDKRVKLAALAENETMEMLYNEVVLSQIENATTPMVPTTSVVSTIKQDPLTNAILTDFYAVISADGWSKVVYPDQVRLNVRNDAPTSENVVEATRLATKFFTVSKESEERVTSTCYGTEIVIKLTIYMASTAGRNTAEAYSLVNIGLVGTTNGTNVTVKTATLKRMMQLSCYMSAFDWHPFITNTLYMDETTQNAQAFAFMMGDIHNITYLTDTDFDHINRVCLYSE